MSTDTAAQSRALYAQLLALPAPPYPDTGRAPADAALQAQTAALLVHPALECAYHLLNHALYPAHFLVRHMQNARAGQHLHGILHRIEGDYANARVWYREASGLGERANEETVKGGEEGFVRFWSGVAGVGVEDGEGRQQERALDAAMAFLDRVERFNSESKSQMQDAVRGADERKDIERISKAELVSVVEWVAAKYGWGHWDGGDASKAFTGRDRNSEIVEQQSVVRGSSSTSPPTALSSPPSNSNTTYLTVSKCTAIVHDGPTESRPPPLNSLTALQPPSSDGAPRRTLLATYTGMPVPPTPAVSSGSAHSGSLGPRSTTATAESDRPRTVHVSARLPIAIFAVYMGLVLLVLTVRTG